MKRVLRMALGVAFAVGLLAPATAYAISVDCADENGECTISNDFGDMIECDCGALGGGGVTGGNEWDGLNEAELTEACFGVLESFCMSFDTDFPTTGFPDTDSVGSDSFSTSDSATTDPTDPTDTESASSTVGDTDGLTGDTDGLTTGDTLGGTSTGIVVPTSGGIADSDDTTTDPTDASASMSAGSSGPSGTTPDPSVGGSSGGSDEDPEQNDEASGCGCTASQGSGPISALALLGLLGLRRRRACG